MARRLARLLQQRYGHEANVEHLTRALSASTRAGMVAQLLTWCDDDVERAALELVQRRLEERQADDRERFAADGMDLAAFDGL